MKRSAKSSFMPGAHVRGCHSALSCTLDLIIYVIGISRWSASPCGRGNFCAIGAKPFCDLNAGLPAARCRCSFIALRCMFSWILIRSSLHSAPHSADSLHESRWRFSGAQTGSARFSCQVGCIRETFEETGILPVRVPHGALLKQHRAAVNADTGAFKHVVDMYARTSNRVALFSFYRICSRAVADVWHGLCSHPQSC